MKGRFAPSPSGRMHLGNIYAALLSWLSARSQGGSWLLRIEDLDRQRCKPAYAAQLIDDIRWLGLTWDEGGTPAYFQSQRDAFYEESFAAMEAQGLVYDCFCRRADLQAASAPHASDGTPIYSGRCRALLPEERLRLSAERSPAKRIRVSDEEVSFVDGHYGLQRCHLLHDCGDFVLRRADGNFAYQLAVVTDDALMGVTEVVRGRDLLAATHQQLYLYKKLGFAPPRYFHLPLLTDASGRRLSKRSKDTDMGFLRSTCTPQEVIGRIMHLCGFTEQPEPLTPAEALAVFRREQLPLHDICTASSTKDAT